MVSCGGCNIVACDKKQPADFQEDQRTVDYRINSSNDICSVEKGLPRFGVYYGTLKAAIVRGS